MTEMATAEDTRRVFREIDEMLASQYRHMEQIGQTGPLRREQFGHLTLAMQITDSLRRLFRAEAERQLAP